MPLTSTNGWQEALAALNLLKSETTNDGCIKTKRLCCGWDHNYLLKVLTGGI